MQLTLDKLKALCSVPQEALDTAITEVRSIGQALNIENAKGIEFCKSVVQMRQVLWAAVFC